MGKATRWFRSLFLSSRKSPGSSPATDKRKSKWVPSNSDQYSSTKLKNHAEDPLASPYSEGLDANKHAIAVAAATAVVAEAALAAAQAAAEVVRLTSGGGSGRNTSYASGDRRIVLAAVKIQSAFRAYLAKRALRALKGLVKLQALVRGHIVRKQSADMLRRMQAMARIQARASKHRAYTSEYPNPKMNCMPNLRKYDERSNIANYGGSLLKLQQTHPRSRFGNNIVNNESSQMATRWLNHWMEQYNWNNDNGQAGEDDKILEIDTWKPRQSSTTRKETNIPTSQYFSAWKEQEHSRLSSKLLKPNPSISSEDVPSLISPKHPPEGDQIAARTAESSPRVHSASSRPTSNQRGPFTPARSECSRSLFGDYMSHPSYMANTESSRAKLRSHSAPKQRMQLEELSLSGKFGKNIWDSDAVSEKDFALPSNNHRSNSYLYSGHGKRQGTPTRDAPSGFGSMYGRRV